MADSTLRHRLLLFRRLENDSSRQKYLSRGKAAQGDAGRETRFLEFFAVNIRNPNTRQAYLAAAHGFAEWCHGREVGFGSIEPMIVAAYVETLTRH